MSLTSLPDRKTPSTPIELTFEASTGLPSANQEVLLIGHMGATGGAASGSAEANRVILISNAGDFVLGREEAEEKFGPGSELAKMIVAAIKANEGGSPVALKAIGLPSGETGFGPQDVALEAVKRVKAEFVVSCYDGVSATLRNKLRDAVEAMSGPERVMNNQFGTFGVVFNRSTVDKATLPTVDSYNMLCIHMPDTGTGPDAPAYSVAEMAAACAARIAAGAIPFNPMNDVTIRGIEAPAKDADWITVGIGLESEVILGRGWIPLKVKSSGEVAFVRTITSRLFQEDGVTPVTDYIDAQDFQVLFFWRKTIRTRVAQPDFQNVKASAERATALRSELIRLAVLFEDQAMFQGVSDLSKEFQVALGLSDRSRFDFKTPVNVIPGLHVLAGNIAASTRFGFVSL